MPKDPEKLLRQMAQRGWTWAQVQEALDGGLWFPAVNKETNGAAKRYIHPQTGRSVVIDDQTGEVIHVGGDGYVY